MYIKSHVPLMLQNNVTLVSCAPRPFQEATLSLVRALPGGGVSVRRDVQNQECLWQEL